MIHEKDGIREHIKVFVNQEQVHNLNVALRTADEVQIIAAPRGDLS